MRFFAAVFTVVVGLAGYVAAENCYCFDLSVGGVGGSKCGSWSTAGVSGYCPGDISNQAVCCDACSEFFFSTIGQASITNEPCSGDHGC